MQCITPFPVRNKHRDINNQNLIINVPCGKCIPCRKRRASHWSFRIYEESKVSDTSCFITLTYEEPPYSQNGFPTLVKKDYQKFFKRLRKLAPNKKLKYFACGEYGTQTERPHYHAIIFNLPKSIINNPDIIRNTWKHGHIHLTASNIKTINYVVGYITKGYFQKKNELDDRQPDFQLMSKGLGLSYLTPKMKNFYKQRQLFAIVHKDGHILSMPRYYKEKIYNRLELTNLYKEWIEIQSMKFEPIFNDCGKTKHDYIVDINRAHEKQLKLKRAKL